ALENDEYREGTRLAVMECLVKLGNRRAAMVEYDRLKTLLRDELGVEPLAETEEAAKLLLGGGSVHGWPEPATQTSSESVEPEPVAASAQVRLKRVARGSSR